MPLTAALSRKFYDRFGDDIVGELVNWFNMIDATYRSDLFQLNERNFERFEARLAQAIAEQSASLRTEIAEQSASLRKEMAEQGARLRKEMAEQSASLRGESAEQGTSLRAEIAGLRVDLIQQGSTLRSEMAGMEERLGQRINSLEVRTARDSLIQTRWMIGLWAAQMTAFIGTILIVLQR